MRILLAEDDSVLSDGITKALRQQGYVVDWVKAGDDAEFAVSATPYDLLVLDLSLPGKDGLDVLKSLRNVGNTVSVLILTARDSLEDRVTGLDLGADDYLTKPFDLLELEARIRALIRRKHFDTRPQITHGRIRFDTGARQVYMDDQLIELSAKEIGVLEILLINMGQVVSKEQLVEHLYGWEDEVGDNAIEVYVHRLRKKLEACGLNLRTIRGLGYLLENE